MVYEWGADMHHGFGAIWRLGSDYREPKNVGKSVTRIGIDNSQFEKCI